MFFPVSIGVDISPSRVTIVGMRQSLSGVASVAQESFAIDADAPVADQMDGIKQHLIAFIDRHRLETAGRFLAAPLSSAMWRQIVLPAAARENLADTIRYEAEKYLPIPLEELYWDYQIIDDTRTAGELTILLVVTRRGDLAPFSELAQNLPGGLSGVEPAISAIANVFQRHMDVVPHDDFGLLVLTDDQIHLIHMHRGALQGGRTYDRPADAEEVVGLVRKGLSALRLGVVGDDRPVEAFPLVVSAAGPDEALMQQFDEALPQFAWHKLAVAESVLPKADMLPAYGLALKGLQKPVRAINLLPARQRKQPSRWGLYLMAVLLALTLVSGIAWGASALLQKRLYHTRLDREINRLTEEVADIERRQADIEALRHKLEFLQEQKRTPQNVLDILKALTDIIPDSAWLREIAIESDRIRIDGYADAAAELIPLIDASPLFTDVSFLAAITRGRDGKEKFRIGFRLAGTSPK